MISKEAAKVASNEILSKEYNSLRAKRRQALYFRYGQILDKKLVQECGAKPELIEQAIRYSHSRWQVNLAAFFWLSVPLLLIYMFDNIHIVAISLLFIGGGFALAKLIKHYIKIYLTTIKNIS